MQTATATDYLETYLFKGLFERELGRKRYYVKSKLLYFSQKPYQLSLSLSKSVSLFQAINFQARYRNQAHGFLPVFFSDTLFLFPKA